MPNKLHRQVKGLAADKSDKLNLISGSLGITINGQKTVEVPQRDGYVFVRLRGSQSELIQAYNASVSPIYDLPVLLTRQGNHYAVYGRDLEQYNNWGDTPYLPKHGTQHSFAPELGLGGDVTWIYSRQFVPMLAMPSGSTGAASLVVNPYIYRNPSDGSFEYIGNEGTASFLPAKPTDTQARMMLLYWDLDTNTSGMITGSLFSESITGTASVTPYIPSINDTQKVPLAAVRLVSGTTTLGWDNIYDVRQFAVNTASPFSGGFGVWDEGVSQGTGTILNFVGENVDASISGSVVRIFVTGSVGGSNPPITGSVVIQDEGVVKGSALSLNFVGSNIDASISGTVARIFVTGSASGGSPTFSPWTSGSSGAGSIQPLYAPAGASALGDFALAHGNGSTALGTASHAEGQGNLASGTYSFAGGQGNKSLGSASFSAGVGNVAAGSASFVEGSSNIVSGSNSAILAGAGNILHGQRSSILSGQNTTGTADDTAYMEFANVKRLNSGTSVSNIGISSQGFLVTGSAGGGGREALTANRTYYVRTDGSDSNTGLVDSASGAFLTIQKAVDVTATLDMSIYDVTIDIGNGTYAEQVTLKQCVGAGTVYIVGDTTTPANVVVSGATAFSADNIKTLYNIQGVKGTGAGSFILAQNGALVDFGNVDIANTVQQLRCTDNASLRCVANYTISAGGTHHWVSVGGGVFRVQIKTIALIGTPAYSSQFASLDVGGLMIVNGNTFSGSATGTRYLVNSNSVLSTSGGGANYLPGNVAGSVTTGGQYL